MDLNYLKKIIKIFEESQISELEVDEESLKLKLVKNTNHYINESHPHNTQHTVVHEIHSNQSNSIQSVKTELKQPEPQQQVADNSGLHEILSPIVGTFYKAPSPESPSYVEVGSHISNGSTLCIVEAMKLMNEIESDVSGTIMKILVENGKPVEFNQPLFLIKVD